jgi:tetratricopeptide (TPR) repeat protein
MAAAQDPETYARLKAAYFELEALPEAVRAQRLAEHHAQDPAFAAALARRLNPGAAPGDVLTRAVEPETLPQIAGYRVVRELGRGGMGRVWLAERSLDGTTQTVALKQILHGRWDDDDLRRFQRERRILAALDHPNIAALIDGGRDQSGAPYLATNHVDGIALDRHCRDGNLSLRERVRLLRDVASAVAHAHRNLVVHRDLKPANILVTRDGVPKLLDFGIARLLDEAAITTTGPSQMTLRYAAPEQIQQGIAAAGTSVDVYALGVLLYELIAEVSPYGDCGSTAALLRAILDVQPAPPSRMRAQQSDHDLDAICLRALRKRPEDRYPSADALVDDLDRWLAGEPVEARREERGYRLRAMLRRYWFVIATMITVLVAIAGLVTFHVAALDRQLAETKRERDKAKAVAAYLEELFASASPSATRVGDLTAKELLSLSVARLEEGDLTGMDDDARASMFHAAGRIMRGQGLADEAARMFDRALALWLALPAVPEDEVADAYNERAMVHFGRGEYEQTLAVLTQALDRRDALADRVSVQRGVLLQLRSVCLRTMGRNGEAIAALSESVDILAGQLPESRANYATSLGNLGTFLVTEGQLEEGHGKLKDSLAQLALLKPERTPLLLSLRRNYAMSLRELGRFDEADREYADLLQRMRAFFGDNHVEIARTQHSLAQTLMVQGRLEEADRALDEAERVELALGNHNDPRLLAYRADRARIRMARGDHAGAIELLTPVLAQREAGVISERSNIDAERAALAHAQCQLQASSELAQVMREAVARMHKTPPLPRALITQAEAWATQCTSASTSAAIGPQR